MAKVLIFVGLSVTLLGVLLHIFPSIKPGQLPGDLQWSFGKGRVYVPLMTSLVISVILSAALYLYRKFL